MIVVPRRTRRNNLFCLSAVASARRRKSRCGFFGGGNLLPSLGVVLLGASLHAQRASSPQQIPIATFRSSIEAIAIDVYVTDAEGKPVSGLTADDFELIEC